MLIILALFINSNPMKNAAKTTEKSPLSVASKREVTRPKLINPKREELTPAILKTFRGYEHLSDGEAEEKCESIKTFARLLLEYFSSVEKSIVIDNQQVIPLESKKNPVISITKNKTKPKAA
jgi:hypothetical protein